MADESEPLTEEEFRRWVPVPALSDILKPHYGADIWRPMLLKQVIDDDVLAAARKVIRRSAGRESTEQFRLIPKKLWNESRATNWVNEFWQTGHIIMLERVYPNDVEWSCTEVRFDPEGVGRLSPPKFAGLSVQEPPPPVAPVAPTHQPPSGMAPPIRSATRDDSPISKATLHAWWAMCKTMKEPDLWTIEDMRSFYDRCFPDKFLSRDRLRELRPAAKSGPKPGAAELA